MSRQLNYKGNEAVFRENLVNDVMFLTFDLIERTNMVHHGFSTRMGGVSEGIFESMNLSYTCGDDEKCVRENFTRMAHAIGVKPESLTFSKQTHTTNVRKITEEDRGKGMMIPLDYDDVDGLITNVPGITLTTFYADCVPLFFVDTVNRAIGLTHSGWKGTVGKIGKVTVEKMMEEYGTDPKNVIAAIGPSICQDCYEVSEDVIEQFKRNYDETYWNELFYKKDNGKYQLNLWKANEIVFLETGISKENIAVTNVCTCCNGDKLFSHRASKGQRGSLAAFMALK